MPPTIHFNNYSSKSQLGVQTTGEVRRSGEEGERKEKKGKRYKGRGGEGRVGLVREEEIALFRSWRQGSSCKGSLWPLMFLPLFSALPYPFLSSWVNKWNLYSRFLCTGIPNRRCVFKPINSNIHGHLVLSQFCEIKMKQLWLKCM